MRAGLSLEDTSGMLEEENKFPASQPSFAELDYSLSTIVKPWSKMKWRSGDGKVLYFKDEKGWYAHANYGDLEGAMRDVGLLYEKEASLAEAAFAAVHFPTLKETRQAAAMCALEADISLDNRLTRHGLTEYRIGSLPLYVTSFNPNSWMIHCFSSSIGKLPASLEPFFPDGIEAFALKCREAKLVGLDGARWSRRAQAVQAIRSFIQGLP